MNLSEMTGLAGLALLLETTGLALLLETTRLALLLDMIGCCKFIFLF